MKKPFTLHGMFPSTGGVMKTGTSRMIAETMIRNGLAWRGIDSDAGNTSGQGKDRFGLHKLYPAYAERLPFRDAAGRQLTADRDAWSAKIMEYAEDDTTEHLLLDVAASQSHDIMRVLKADHVLDDLADMGARIIGWHPVGDDGVKHEGLGDWIDWLDANLDYREMVQLVVPLNMVMGARVRDIEDLAGVLTPNLDFPSYHSSAVYKRAKAGAVTHVAMPTLVPPSAYAVWNASLESEVKSMGAWAASEPEAGEPRTVKNARRAIKSWLNKIDPVIMGVIIPDDDQEAAA